MIRNASISRLDCFLFSLFNLYLYHPNFSFRAHNNEVKMPQGSFSFFFNTLDISQGHKDLYSYLNIIELIKLMTLNEIKQDIKDITNFCSFVCFQFDKWLCTWIHCKILTKILEHTYIILHCLAIRKIVCLRLILVVSLIHHM